MIIELLHRWIGIRYRWLGFESQTTRTQGCRIHSYRWNLNRTKQTIMFLHGLGTSASSWIYVAPHFRHAFNIVLPDLPGFGFSAPPDDLTEPIESYTSSMAQFAQLMLPERFTLVGHSLGGWIAMRLALEMPERIERLVLINPAGIRYDGVERQAELFTIGSIASTRTLIRHIWHRIPWYFPLTYPFITSEMKRRHVGDIVHFITPPDFVDTHLSNLHMPIDIVWGRNDQLIDARSIDIIRPAVPHATIAFIDHCGHVPQLEQPAELTRQLAGILFPRT